MSQNPYAHIWAGGGGGGGGAANGINGELFKGFTIFSIEKVSILILCH